MSVDRSARSAPCLTWFQGLRKPIWLIQARSALTGLFPPVGKCGRYVVSTHGCLSERSYITAKTGENMRAFNSYVICHQGKAVKEKFSQRSNSEFLSSCIHIYKTHLYFFLLTTYVAKSHANECSFSLSELPRSLWRRDTLLVSFLSKALDHQVEFLS